MKPSALCAAKANLRKRGVNPLSFADKLQGGAVSRRRSLRCFFSVPLDQNAQDFDTIKGKYSAVCCLGQFCDGGVLTPYFLRISYTEQPCQEGVPCDAIAWVPFDQTVQIFDAIRMKSFALCC